MTTRTQQHRALVRSSRQWHSGLAITAIAGALTIALGWIAFRGHWPPRSLADPMHTRGVQ